MYTYGQRLFWCSGPAMNMFMFPIHKWLLSQNIQLNGLSHMEKHNNVNINICTVSLVYTVAQISRPQGVLYCPVNSFIHNSPPSQFPTQSLTPFPPGHWHLSAPVLTHSFLLASLCRTPAITTTLPTCLHGSVIGRCLDGCSFQPIADHSQVVMCRETLQWPGWPAEYERWEEAMNATHKSTEMHRHVAWDHSAAQSVWGPCPGCQCCCDVSFMLPLCGILLKHVDRGIILAYDRFPYIHRLLITHVNSQILRIRVFNGPAHQIIWGGTHWISKSK